MNKFNFTKYFIDTTVKRNNLILFFFFIFVSCGKKEPIGYELAKPREGEIKVIKGIVDSFTISHSFASPIVIDLFAINSNKFEAISYCKFEFDSISTPESLYITGISNGKLIVGKIDSIPDSLNWSNRPDTHIIGSIEVKKDSVVKLGLNLPSDTLFCFAFSTDSGRIKFKIPKMKIIGDTILSSPILSTYVDTSYFSDSAYVESGAFATVCSVFLKLKFTEKVTGNDTDFIEVDTLDSTMIKKYLLDSVTVNNAEFITTIDTNNSYEWYPIDIGAEYKTTTSYKATIKNDTLKLLFEPIVSKWFNSFSRLCFVIKCENNKIARVVFNDIKESKISIVYTLPPSRKR